MTNVARVSCESPYAGGGFLVEVFDDRPQLHLSRLFHHQRSDCDVLNPDANLRGSAIGHTTTPLCRPKPAFSTNANPSDESTGSEGQYAPT